MCPSAAPPGAGPPPGLCESCRHRQLVPNTRGSTFYLCRRSREDSSFPRYPRLPVLECRGYERSDPDEPGDAGGRRAR